MPRQKNATNAGFIESALEQKQDELEERIEASIKQGELSKAEKPKSPTKVLETGSTASNSTEQGITGSSKETAEK